jgi:hypothetical protein
VAGGRLDYFCSRRSIEARERIFGTASTAEVWLLLEYNGPWSRDLLPDSQLPAEVKEALAAVVRGDPETRLQFIRNDLRGKAGLSFFLAMSRERRQALYRFDLDDYRDLLKIDLAGLISGAVTDELHLVDDPLYLVCVDGKHDKCCAKFGLPTYRAMVRAADQAAWQSSHVGGDRFAANVVCLPSGVYYGHVEPHEAERIVHDTTQGHLYLERYRGRCYYGFSTQAAEYFARIASGLDGLAALTVSDVRRTADLVRVRLRQQDSGREHVVELVRESSEMRWLTCSAEVEHEVPQFTLRSYRVEHAP